MGFGILFLGYFIAGIVFVGYLSVANLLGGAVMIFALLKLREYNKSFNLPLVIILAGSLFYAFLSVVDIFKWVGHPIITFGTTSALVVEIADMVLKFAINATLLWAIREIAKETEIGKIYVASTRNFVFFCILFTLQIVSKLPFAMTQRLGIVSVLLMLALVVLNLILIFSCYMNICDSDDVDMARKRSRFAIVNKFRDEMDRRREAADAERERIKKERDQKRKNRRKK